MKKLACLLLDEEVRGEALSEENSKRFHVHCKKKGSLSVCLSQAPVFKDSCV